MSIVTESLVKCPVCEQGHKSLARVVGLAMIACESVRGPVGTTLTFPAAGVVVAKAGLYVDSLPDKPKSVADLMSEIAEIERGKVAVADEGAKRAELEAKLAKLKTEQAS